MCFFIKTFCRLYNITPTGLRVSEYLITKVRNRLPFINSSVFSSRAKSSDLTEIFDENEMKAIRYVMKRYDSTFTDEYGK